MAKISDDPGALARVMRTFGFTESQARFFIAVDQGQIAGDVEELPESFEEAAEELRNRAEEEEESEET